MVDLHYRSGQLEMRTNQLKQALRVNARCALL
jgi:hypothetical protein